MKKIVVPGEQVSDRPVQCDGCFVDAGKTFATTMSLATDERVIPLKGRYVPVLGDFVVGIVKESIVIGYLLDLNSPYLAKLGDRDCREEYRHGDVVSVKLASVNEVHDAMAMEPRKLEGGTLVAIEPVKVPRVIGRNGSMLALVQDHTGAQVSVGKNGRVYVKGGNVALAVQAINKICAEAHTSGLTERMTDFLKREAARSEQVN
ncbi:MAG: KH domain-containing protein [Candidatus Micrarchaeia archaeon]